jgi:hypothetical protein
MIPDLNDTNEIERIIRNVDPTARLWDFTAPWVTYKQREFEFISENFTISIIDLFKGAIPSVTCLETLIGHQPPLLAPTILLDSNVMASLHQFVTGPEKLTDKHKKVIVQLLDYLILERVDYNPAFYYIESFARTTNADQKIIDYTKTILSLHMMDELHFLKKRQIRQDPATLEKYVLKFRASNIEEMAHLQFEHFKSGYAPNIDWKIMYLVILKAALIQQARSASFQYKLKELYKFIYSIFGVLFARELFIAAFYFSGELDKFIPLQKGANFESTINKLQSTAWDLYLLRLPEVLLAMDNQPISFAAVCTGDRSVQYIGGKFRIRKLYISQGISTPELEMDFSAISDPTSENGNIVYKLFDEFKEKREKRRKNFDTDQVLNNIDNVVNELEFEVKKFCK